MSSFRYPAVSGTGSGVSTYANFASLPGSATDGTLAVTLDTHDLYIYNAGLTTWELVSAGGGGATYNPRPPITLNSMDIANKYVDLGVVPTQPTLTRLQIISGVEQLYGVDFSISGTLLVWNGLVLDGILESGDKLVVNLI
jgi:hypothetical protein